MVLGAASGRADAKLPSPERRSANGAGGGGGGGRGLEGPSTPARPWRRRRRRRERRPRRRRRRLGGGDGSDGHGDGGGGAGGWEGQPRVGAHVVVHRDPYGRAQADRQLDVELLARVRKLSSWLSTVMDVALDAVRHGCRRHSGPRIFALVRRCSSTPGVGGKVGAEVELHRLVDVLLHDDVDLEIRLQAGQRLRGLPPQPEDRRRRASRPHLDARLCSRSRSQELVDPRAAVIEGQRRAGPRSSRAAPVGRARVGQRQRERTMSTRLVSTLSRMVQPWSAS